MNSLSDENKNLKNKIMEIMETINEYKNESEESLNKYMKENEEKNILINKYKTENEEKNNKLNEFTNIVNNLQKEIQEYSTQNEQYKKFLDEKNIEISQKNEEINQNEQKNLNIIDNLQNKLTKNNEIYLQEKKGFNDKILNIEKNIEILTKEKEDLNTSHIKEKNILENKITELMDILKEYEHETNDIGINTDEYLLNQKLNDMYNKEKKKLQDDIINYEKMELNKPFQCSICKQNFSLDVNLKEHMLKEHTIITDEDKDENSNEKDINNNIKSEDDSKKDEKNYEGNNNNSQNDNNKIGLGFFGRLMAPIFLTENEIKSING